MNNNLHLSTPFLLKMAQRNITSFFSSPSGKRSRPSENDDIASDSDSTSDNELGELTVPVTMIGDNGLETETESASSSTSVCDAECCQMHKPYQPPNSVLISKRIQGQQNRYFQQSWFKDHSWISYCITLHKAFCFSCRFAASKSLISERNKSSNSYSAFVINGFDNWKKAKQRLHEHEKSQLHLEATMKL